MKSNNSDDKKVDKPRSKRIELSPFLWSKFGRYKSRTGIDFTNFVRKKVEELPD